MPYRVDVTRLETAMINRAAQVAQSRISGASRSGGSPAPARDVTRPGTDDGGGIVTIHDFMLGVDALGQPGAELRVKGKEINYVR